MAKKTVDDAREPAGELVTAEHINNPVLTDADMPLLRLCASKIVTVDAPDGKVSWRMGHLLHIANLYKSDPAKTERDYADDLAVARAYSADVWEALLK